MKKIENQNMDREQEYDLAIVIPAYKITYFEEALKSISEQSCKRFTLYIGDDNSPHDLYEIVTKYNSEINIIYKKFDHNLGGVDLVAQWERCIDLVRNESYIWFFSDDDIMSKDCVEAFYQEQQGNNFDLYRFDVNIINSKGDEISKVNIEKHISSQIFTKRNIYGEIKSFAVEYIFSKEKFLAMGRFENFDMAWGSDYATWGKISIDKGIKKIENGCVLWRQSEENISPDISASVVVRKIEAMNMYIKWLNIFYNGEFDSISHIIFLRQLKLGVIILPMRQILSYIWGYKKNNECGNVKLFYLYFYILLFWSYIKIKKNI